MMDTSLFLPPIFGFLATCVLTYGALKLFPRLKLMDRPHEYGISRAPIPYSGGGVFFIVFFVGTLLFVEVSRPLSAVIFAGLLITVVSFIDDRIRLSPWLRLCAQALAGVIVVIAGIQIQVINTPFGTPLFLDGVSFELAGHTIWLFSALLIIGWLMLMMNVMNWLDGIPGLASGVSTIGQISLFILSTRQFHIVDQNAVITISSILAASTLAFLLFDFYPPKILMGDTGSMFLGFILGALSILAGGKLATALLIMGFPVLDALWVILKRVAQRRSPMRGDYSHLHHRLLQAGFSPRKALLFNYFFCSLFAGIALLSPTPFSKGLALGSVVVIMALVGLIIVGLKGQKGVHKF